MDPGLRVDKNIKRRKTPFHKGSYVNTQDIPPPKTNGYTYIVTVRDGVSA